MKTLLTSSALALSMMGAQAQNQDTVNLYGEMERPEVVAYRETVRNNIRSTLDTV
jgi:hypothetical protein